MTDSARCRESLTFPSAEPVGSVWPIILIDSKSMPFILVRKASRSSRAVVLIAALPSENKVSADKVTVSLAGAGAGLGMGAGSGAATGADQVSSARSSLAGCGASGFTSTGSGFASIFGAAGRATAGDLGTGCAAARGARVTLLRRAIGRGRSKLQALPAHAGAQAICSYRPPHNRCACRVVPPAEPEGMGRPSQRQQAARRPAS